MRVILLSGVIGALLLSVVWAAPQGSVDHEGHDHQGHDADHFHHLHHGKDEAHPAHEGEEVYKLSKANADFAFNLYNKLSALPEFKSKNIFFSPMSISMALSMLSLGAKGDTFSQLYQALGYSEMTPETVNEAFEHILHMLGHNEEHMQLDTSNAVAVMQGAKVVDKFIEDAKHYFDSEAMSVDFSKPEVAVQEINKYIAQHTNNTITDMLKEVDPATVMMLINCVYFRGEWLEYFEDDTVKEDFHVSENTKVSVDMMNNRGYYELYEDPAKFVTVVRLPYKGSASMVIVLPDMGKMNAVEEGLNAEQFRTWLREMKSSSAVVHMPKYSTSGKYSLKDILESMGVVSAFSDTADFTGMTGEKVKVSKVEHKAVLNVDEKGTEAAAATTVEIVLMSAQVPDEPKVVKINRPFFVFITDYKTRSILFMGKISNPTEK